MLRGENKCYWRYWHLFIVFNVNFEHISNLSLVFPLLLLNRYMFGGYEEGGQINITM